MQPSDRTDLHALASRIQATRMADRLRIAREGYEVARLHPRRTHPLKPFDEHVADAAAWRARLDFLFDNFPAGATFKLCGAECMSVGPAAWTPGRTHKLEVEYVTAGPQGLQELRLPFAMAAALVLGAPL